MYISIIVFFIVLTMLYVPISQRQLHEINTDNFKRKRITHFAFLFREINGRDVKTYGIIYPIYCFYIIGYVLTVVLISLVFILLFTFAVQVETVSLIVSLTSILFMSAYVVTVLVLIHISNKRNKEKEIVY